MIEIKNLNKRFATATVFENYNKQFNSKKMCLQASNGSGKTTLLMIIAGLEKPQSGQIMYANKQHSSPQKYVAIASNRICLPDFLTAQQIIQLTCKALNVPAPIDLINGFKFSEHLHTRFSALSTGNQKKCQLIITFMKRAPYLLLDEPSAALDQASIHYLLNLLDNYLSDKPDGQIILTSHEPDVFLHQGFECTPL